MNKYRNKRLHLTYREIIAALLFLCFVVVSLFFVFRKNTIQEEFNIGETKVDYIIAAPSAQQISEIEAISGVEKVVPFRYRTITCDINKRNINSNLYIIDAVEDLPDTVFSSRLEVQRANETVENPIYITDNFASSSQTKLLDRIDIPFENGTVSFTVAGIYKNDHREVGGTVIAPMNQDLSLAITSSDNRSLAYNGAYVCCTDGSAITAYLETYEPAGDLRNRDEFESEELYTAYLKDRQIIDRSQTVFSTSSYIAETAKRYDSRRTTATVVSIIMIILAVGVAAAIYYYQTHQYIKTELIKDIRNNFTLEQEQEMLTLYSLHYCCILFIAFIIAALLGKVVWNVSILSITNIICLFASALLLFSLFNVIKSKLGKQYSIDFKTVEKEKKATEEEAK